MSDSVLRDLDQARRGRRARQPEGPGPEGPEPDGRRSEGLMLDRQRGEEPSPEGSFGGRLAGPDPEDSPEGRAEEWLEAPERGDRGSGNRQAQPEDRGPQPRTRSRPQPQPRGAQPDDPLMRDLIGGLLRRARTEQGRTLREVAEDAQVSLPYLSEIERGRKEASSEVLAAVYRSLGLSLTDVLAELYHRTARVRLTRTGSHQIAPMPQQAPPARATRPIRSAQQAQVLALAA